MKVYELSSVDILNLVCLYFNHQSLSLKEEGNVLLTNYNNKCFRKKKILDKIVLLYVLHKAISLYTNQNLHIIYQGRLSRIADTVSPTLPIEKDISKVYNIRKKVQKVCIYYIKQSWEENIFLNKVVLPTKFLLFYIFDFELL